MLDAGKKFNSLGFYFHGDGTDKEFEFILDDIGTVDQVVKIGSDCAEDVLYPSLKYGPYIILDRMGDGPLYTLGVEEAIPNSKFPIQNFELKQNYPNPFNGTTNFEFQIPNSEFVTLKIYDILGQEVATLVKEKLNAGIYKKQFFAKNLPSGIYLYVLQTETKKE